MLFSHKYCLSKYGNQYQIDKLLQDEKLHKVAPGVYSDNKDVSELDIITFRYSRSVFTMESAFYYHNLTDTIPEKYCLATTKDDYKISDERVKQFFHRTNTFPIGISSMLYQNSRIRIYDQERMLIELIRNKHSLPFDYYKELVESYRKRIHSLDIEKLQRYIVEFPKQNYIMETIQMEIF